jgi:signal transduction histidine kinase
MPCRFNVWALGLTSGLFFGLGLFFITWWIMLFDGAQAGPVFISRIYRGYSITPIGSFIGLIWASVDCFIGGIIFGWLYNFIARAKREVRA